MNQHEHAHTNARRLQGDAGAAPRQRLRARDDRGYALIMTALLLVPLMVMTAFAVDVGAWYAQSTRIQRAADAASLAGVPYVATNLNLARELAYDAAAANGFTDRT